MDCPRVTYYGLPCLVELKREKQDMGGGTNQQHHEFECVGGYGG